MTSREFRGRLSRRARRAQVWLTPAVLEQLEAYFRLLARWNTKINLTALSLTEPADEAIDRLLIEPLVASRHMGDSALRWLDLGSGGGSPAIPLKILRPAAHLTMVESKARKAAFLGEAVRALGLAATRVENRRFEDVAADSAFKGKADVVTARAVRPDSGLFHSVHKLLGREGRLLLFRGAVPGHAAPELFRKIETITLVGKSSSSLYVYQPVFHGYNILD